MKKNLFFLFSLLLLIAGCNQTELGNLSTKEPQSEAAKIRWYGIKLPDNVQTKGVADGSKRWNPDAGIHIKFLNASSEPEMIDRIKEIAAEWEEYAGIKFHFVESTQNANVRIAFNWNDNDWLTWSYTGTDAKFVKNQSEPTAILGGLEYLDEESFRGDILRLFGQILGLEYEQRHQQWASWKSESAVETYWRGEFEDFFTEWDWNEIREYVFTPLSTQNSYQPLQTENIDEESIMAWPYYQLKRQVTKQMANYELSEGDKAFIAQLYPLPTIQKAWVDPGYFEWKDETKTSLQITELGKQQEYFANVCDGEQLVTAERLFYSANKLKKAPKFNTSNVSVFSGMFSLCSSLKNISELNTSEGMLFNDMFSGCESLTKIPMLDLSKGKTLNAMFRNCISLTEIPQFNTSFATLFSNMFYGCSSLKNIPFLNTSNGKSFFGMFMYCSKLESIPQIDTFNGTDFNYMFLGCDSLKTIPMLNTSNGTDFWGMFCNCKSLTSVPPINTSKGTRFCDMFMNCESLTSIPELYTSNGWAFDGMFSGCISLINVPNLNTSKGIDLRNMFKNCISLTCIPELNTLNCEYFPSMFENCTSLITIPEINTSNGIHFYKMFAGCSSLTSIPNLNTSQGTNFNCMFENCIALASKPQLDLSNATDIQDMYKGTAFE